MSRSPQTTNDPAARTYDAFLSYHPQDRWTLDWLLLRLEAAGLMICVDRRDFAIGLPKVVNRERAVEQSRHTLLILTPRWIESEWAAFEGLLVQSSDPAGLQRRLIPVLLESCALPARIAQLEPADFTDATRWDDELARLVRNLGGDAARARRLAGDLPLDWIPDPAPLPQPHRMPLKRNPLFVGRDDDLKALAAALKPRSGAAAITTGIGGIGKTQLAAEFVHRYGQFFMGGVFWLSCADPAGIDAEVAACGGAGAMELYSDADGFTLAEQVRRVYAAWEQNTPHLLIFDNCDDTPEVSAEALLTTRMPKGGGCRVLVTSRRGQWQRGLGVTAMPLHTLPRAESMTLLRGYRADLNDADADAIAAELGDLPLALTLAGSYLDIYRDEPFGVSAIYLAALRKSLLDHRSLKGTGVPVSLTGHELNVFATFDLSFQRLDTANPTDMLAIAALARAACLAPGEPFPHDLLLTTLMEDEDTEGHDAAAMMRADALRRLLALGLLERAEASSLRIHRLIAAFARAVVHDPTAWPAVACVLSARAYQVNTAGYPSAMQPILMHLQYLIESTFIPEDEQIAALWIHLGFYLQMIGDYATARPLYERALAIFEQVLGPTHPDTAICLINLAGLIENQGNSAAAKPVLERALTICEQALGPTNPITISAMNNLAGLLKRQGDYIAAKPLYERALAIREQVLGPTHPDTATSLNNLARLLKRQGDYIAAKPLYERALAICEQVHGPTHPDTALSVNNLADLIESQGDYVRAKPLYERALAICEQALGPDHPKTSTSLNNLALLLKDQGDYEAVRPLLERALVIREQALGQAHPKTATSLNNLASLLKDQGDYEAARPLYERALAIHERVLGSEHPHTRSIRANLAALDRSQQTPQE